ncbi:MULTISPECIES: efflux RND transporter periplasmic adaptor subunit [Pseudoalteromonas]|uniref:Efflux transporter periplasmic adaptor subunit n=1 Tax=Pseudoalteromonas amylolytica TaxID=1859457 RepID=A0A1S1MUW4_9GAMM|nr:MULTISPECIES: efflux RND transporter periplasmic adaptor subunit [Pseudoalteromonas]OHU86303.1 efflux transporter periplasmic adaptor subunit [Pseudoalteromonas sp. JW3]OHU89592.1 efflux transporter periplasmic adaptor subunit [Pseudoalteromonas amylolytica]
MFTQQSGKALFPFIILVLVAILSYLYLPISQGQVSRAAGAPTTVSAQTASMQEKTLYISAVGSARANQAIHISSSQSDYITDIYFNDGDVIKQGDKLVQLQNEQERLAVKELKINLKEQQRQLKRLEDLAKSQSAARSQLETQRSVVEALQAKLQLEQTRLDELLISAPFTGILGKRLVSVGSFVNSSTSLTTLDDISIIKVDFQVPEKRLATLHTGMTVVGKSDAYGERAFIGQVSHIDPRIDSATRSVQVTASFENPESLLRPGMLMHLELELQTYNAIMLPEKSVIPRQQKHYVFVIDEQQKAKQVEINILARFNGWVAVSSGVETGQQVITEGVIKIRSGSTVSVKS